jgi:formyl-CoA transferase
VCDVVLENYKVGDLAKYGLDYPRLSAINPRVIYCSITGFGQTGPWSHRAGYDFIIQGLAGLMSVTGEADDRPGGGPQKAGVAVADLSTGLYATQAVLAALFHRERTGEGQYIDMALLDVQVAMTANMSSNYLHSGQPPKRWGNAHPNLVPYQTFKASDGWIIVACGNDGQWRRFCTIGGRPDLPDDPRFARVQDRIRNRDLLVPLLEAMVATKTQTAWIDEMEQHGVPCGPINDFKQVYENPQVQARAMTVSIDRADVGPVKMVANPIKASRTPPSYVRPPPRLGEHTDRVLREVLGWDEAAVAAARAQGVIGSSPS